MKWLEEDRGHETPCWTWQWAKDRHGYGVTWNAEEKRTVRAHRFMYEQEHGHLDLSLDIDHLCRQRDCVNPEHMEPATRAVNAQRGARAVVTPDQVREIRASTDTYRALAARFGISHGGIWSIKSGQTWRNVV